MGSSNTVYRLSPNTDGQCEKLLSTHVTHRFVEAPGAVIPIRWHYVEAGDPTATTILFLHGNPESWAAWVDQIDAMSDTYHIIAPDLKGYGQGDKRPGDWRWENCADEMLAMLRQIGVQNAIIVAHDRGCVLADYLGGSHPDFVLGYLRMQQVCHILAPENSPQGRYFADPIFGPAIFGDPDYYFRFRLSKMLKKPVAEDKLATLKAQMSFEGLSEAVIRYFQSSSFEKERLDRTTRLLRNMDFPVQLVQGRLDDGQPPYYFEAPDAHAVNCFPNAKLTWLDAGHYVGLERPEAVTNAVSEFAREISAQV